MAESVSLHTIPPNLNMIQFIFHISWFMNIYIYIMFFSELCLCNGLWEYGSCYIAGFFVDTFCIKPDIACSLYNFVNDAGFISFPPHEHLCYTSATLNRVQGLWDIHRTICLLQIGIRPNFKCVLCVFSIHDVTSVSHETSIQMKIIPGVRTLDITV